MKNTEPFTFNRTKGIVWVCDLAKSSSYLNDNDSADDIENFIPRLYYVSKLLVESYGGKFLKWTGDGFLSFFEFELDRQKEEISKHVFEAAWHLTFMSNITQLGLMPKIKFKIRNGITYEKDALMMRINSNSEVEALDIIGRDVVLAFRLSGIQADFPSIVTVKELVERSNKKFITWKPTVDEKLKFFKGEGFGTQRIMVSTDKIKRPKRNINSLKRRAMNVISKIEFPDPLDPISPISIFTNRMRVGPDWCKEIIMEEVDFLRTKLLDNLKNAIALIDNKVKNNL